MQRRKINMLTRMKYIGMLACLMGGIFLFYTFYYNELLTNLLPKRSSYRKIYV